MYVGKVRGMQEAGGWKLEARDETQLDDNDFLVSLRRKMAF
jgi:hypothetical protein